MVLGVLDMCILRFCFGSGTLASIGARAAGIPYFPASMLLVHQVFEYSHTKNKLSIESIKIYCIILFAGAYHQAQKLRSRRVDFEPFAKNTEIIQNAEPGMS